MATRRYFAIQLDGSVISQVFHSPQEGEGSLPFILDGVPLEAGAADSSYRFVSAGEDGSVNIWEGTY
jgi:hypothetical protein